MKTNWLFPHHYRLMGWLLLLPSLVLGLGTLYGDFQEIYSSFKLIDFTDEVAAIGMIIALLLIAFSREKVEDEMINQVRLECLQWAVVANYAILIVAILLFYQEDFLSVMIYNMFTVLIVFIIRFRLSLWRQGREVLAL